MKLQRNLSMIILLTFALALTGCASSGLMTHPPAASSGLSCAEADSIVTQVAPEAEVVGLKCFFKAYKGVSSLHFDVKVKNISSRDQRYRINLFLDNGKAVGGLLPRKGKPPVIKPGAEASFTYPIKGMAEKAGKVTLLVKTMSR